MFPKYHILFGILFIGILYFVFPQISFLGLTIIFLSSVLIDLDHVIYYFLKTKDWNPFRAYSWYIHKCKETSKIPKIRKKNIYTGFYLFHGIEWLLILFLLGFFIFPIFIYLFIGFSFHLVFDLIFDFYELGTFDKISLIWNYFRFRKLELKR